MCRVGLWCPNGDRWEHVLVTKSANHELFLEQRNQRSRLHFINPTCSDVTSFLVLALLRCNLTGCLLGLVTSSLMPPLGQTKESICYAVSQRRFDARFAPQVGFDGLLVPPKCRPGGSLTTFSFRKMKASWIPDSDLCHSGAQESCECPLGTRRAVPSIWGLRAANLHQAYLRRSSHASLRVFVWSPSKAEALILEIHFTDALLLACRCSAWL